MSFQEWNHFQERENWEKVMKIKGPCHCCDGPSITGWEISEIKSQTSTTSNFYVNINIIISLLQ